MWSGVPFLAYGLTHELGLVPTLRGKDTGVVAMQSSRENRRVEILAVTTITLENIRTGETTTEIYEETY